MIENFGGVSARPGRWHPSAGFAAGGLVNNSGYFRVLAAGLTLALLFVSAGCATRTPAVSEAGQKGGMRSRVAVMGGGSIVQSAAYQSAAADFTNHRVAAALAKVETLLGRSDLSETDRAFLLHQQAICRATLSGKPMVAAAAPVAAPVRAAALTAAQADCGPRALLIACQEMHVPASLPALRQAAGTTGDGTNLAGLIRAAQSVGVKAEGVQMDGASLSNLNLDNAPALAWVDGNHFITVLSIHGDSATIRDPNQSGDEDISLRTGPTGLLARSGGILLLLSRSRSRPVTANKAAGA